MSTSHCIFLCSVMYPLWCPGLNTILYVPAVRATNYKDSAWEADVSREWTACDRFENQKIIAINIKKRVATIPKASPTRRRPFGQ